MPDGRTSDDKHIDYGTGDNIPMPPGFNVTEDFETCSGANGRMMGDEEQLIEQGEGIY